MLRSFYFALLACAFSFSYSQGITVTGKIIDETKAPAAGTSVNLFNFPDSSLVKGVNADSNGIFLFEGLTPYHNYLLKIWPLGYTPIYRVLNISNVSITLGTIPLTTKAHSLNEVEVTAKLPLATLSGDTTSYSANAYKVNKDATAEDLATKMPGVTILDGKVQAQGEDVKQVLVDGKVFFGDDANTVLKNLPAEVIDKIQVFDKKSDQAQFTGFDDGNTTKTLNIVTKAQFRNGVFGKVYGGYGPDDKYRTGGVVNVFKGNRRLTFLAQTNNVNEQNFSAEDLVGISSTAGGNAGGGGNRGRGGNRGGGPGSHGGGSSNATDNFLVSTQNGINTPTSFGLNYSDKWGKKTDITASYFLNSTKNISTTSLVQHYVLGSNNGLVYNETNNSFNTNTNNRLNLKLETKLDSQNSIIFQPKLSFQVNDGSKTLFGQNTQIGLILSSTSNNSSSNLAGYSLSFPILYRHAFAKRGRTFSVNANPSFTKNTGNNTLYTINTYANDTAIAGDTIDQHATLLKHGTGVSGNIIYTEPLNKTSFLSFNYSTSYTQNYSSKRTYNKDPASDAYSSLDSLYTNVFTSQYQTQAAGMGYRYQKEKINFAVNVAYQWAQLNKAQEIPTTYNQSKTFQSILPSAQFQYKFTPQQNLRINYRSNNNAPSIDQLQDVINNSNSLQLTTGNPELKQDFQQNLFMRYTAVDTKKARAFFALLGGNYSMNYIGNGVLIANHDTVVYNNIFLQSGSQIQRPVNINGYYSLRSFVNYSFPLSKIKTNFSVNASATYNRIPGLINQQTNYANTTTGGLGLVLASNISERLDFTISSNSSYSTINNTLQTSSNSNYFSQNSKFKITASPAKAIVLVSEYSNQLYSGLSSNYNKSISLWNAAIGYKFMKNKQAEIRLTVYDLLNQNKSIQRTNTESYTQDLQTNVLNRYYMITFTYNFKKYFNAKPGDKAK